MPWVASKSRRLRRRSPSSAWAMPGLWDPQRTLRGLKVLGVAAALIAFLIGWWWTECSLVEYTRWARAAAVTPEGVVLADAPPWMQSYPGAAAQIATAVAERISDNPLDGPSLQAAAAALERQAWVRHVKQVRRLPGGRVEVRAVYRQPIAIVAGRAGYHLVDAEAVRLPGLYVRQQVNRLGLAVITAVASAPPGVGEPWPGEPIRAALSLVQLLAGEAYADQIIAYDVRERDERNRIHLVLYTKHGKVRWGLPPGQEQVLEERAVVKRQWLRRVAARHSGRVDAGGQVVELFRAAIYVYQPAMQGDVADTGYTFNR